MKLFTCTVVLLGITLQCTTTLALECIPGNGGYSYCYQYPTSVSSKCTEGHPVIVWMNGHSTFGPGGMADRAARDGLGQHFGNPTLQDFLIIVPLVDDPASQHYHPDKVDFVVNKVIQEYSSQGKVDGNSLYLAGHSAGCRGSIRYAISYNEKVTAITCSGGGAEVQPPAGWSHTRETEHEYYGWRLVADPSVQETFTKLNTLTNIPIRLLQGGADETAKGDRDTPVAAPQATHDELKALGSAVVELVPVDGANHDAMSAYWGPKVGEILSWLQSKRKGGACTPQAARKLGRAAMWPGKASLDDIENPM